MAREPLSFVTLLQYCFYQIFIIEGPVPVLRVVLETLNKLSSELGKHTSLLLLLSIGEHQSTIQQ